MKIQKLINNSVFGENVVTVITVFLALIALILFAKIELASAEENTKLIQRKYSQMSSEEAEELQGENIREVPLPSGFRWKRVPRDVQGVWIDRKDYVVFGYGIGYEVVSRCSQYVPKKAEDLAKWCPHFLTGVFVSTVGLTLVDCECYHFEMGKWMPMSHIKQGRYRVEVCKYGICLISSNNRFFIIFKEPLKEGKEISGKPADRIIPKISLSAKTNGIEIKVAGRSILLK
ncbi:MAG TPA: hypothetical protein ENI35_02130 [Candidatus Desulfofervidus auxilii]|uniref:Uncharacterized protein n=1 Tax=Desulfofervidus auxilii TaxID=1621989 RepID=A0A7C1VNV8_DESA2|nr:hypothetical protein [Candidatus Desulfofervidus auxilii]